MSRQLHPLRALDLRIALPHKEVIAYIDTIRLLFRRRIPEHAWMRLCELSDGRIKEIVPRRKAVTARLRRRKKVCQRIRIQRPTREVLLYLAGLKDISFFVTRLDIAYDFVCQTYEELRRCEDVLQRAVIQKWPGGRQPHQAEATMYWSSKLKLTRNIALYADKPSKVGPRSACHLELRFYGSRNIPAPLKGLRHLANGIDALALLKQQTKLGLIDQDRVNSAVRYWADARIAQTELPGHSPEEVRKRLVRLLCRALQNAHFVPDPGTIHRAIGQDVYKKLFLRPAVIMRKWEDAIDSPRWHTWRLVKEVGSVQMAKANGVR